MAKMYENYDHFNRAKSACRRCAIGAVYNRVVLSCGQTLHPKVVVVGEGPGAEEVVQGEPFVGKSGRILRHILNALEFRRQNTLITNIIPCRPENNVFPNDDSMVRSCVEMWLIEELNILKPDLMLLLGAKPLKFILGMEGIAKIRGTWFQVPESYIPTGKTIFAMPTFHPSYVARMEHTPEGEKIAGGFRSDIEAVAKRAGFIPQ